MPAVGGEAVPPGDGELGGGRKAGAGFDRREAGMDGEGGGEP